MQTLNTTWNKITNYLYPKCLLSAENVQAAEMQCSLVKTCFGKLVYNEIDINWGQLFWEISYYKRKFIWEKKTGEYKTDAR